MLKYRGERCPLDNVANGHRGQATPPLRGTSCLHPTHPSFWVPPSGPLRSPIHFPAAPCPSRRAARSLSSPGHTGGAGGVTVSCFCPERQEMCDKQTHMKEEGRSGFLSEGWMGLNDTGGGGGRLPVTLLPHQLGVFATKSRLFFRRPRQYNGTVIDYLYLFNTNTVDTGQ